LTSDSGYDDTYVALDNNLGAVTWRKAGFTFDKETQPPQELVFGVFGPDMLDGPGGVFLGLIKETDKRIYPSFLGQTGYDSFCVDLRDQTNTATNTSSPQLILSKDPMILNDDYIPLTTDLNRRYKTSVVHYTAKASSFIVNGQPFLQIKKKKPTYIIFDSGCSGMSVPEELLQDRYIQARKNKEKSLWGNVTVTFETQAGKEVQLTAIKPLTTPLDKATLSKYRGNIIVLGLAFLNGFAMTIDIKDGKVQFSK